MTTTAECVKLGSEMTNQIYKIGNPPPAGWTIVKLVDGKGADLNLEKLSWPHLIIVG